MNALMEFLDKKGQEYAPFEPKRAPEILALLNLTLPKKLKVIHIIGTNGKGSTGRFLALMLYQKGFNVGHFTSPHLLNFNERFWSTAKN